MLRSVAKYGAVATSAVTGTVLATSEKARRGVKEAADDPSNAPSKLYEAATEGLEETRDKFVEALPESVQDLVDDEDDAHNSPEEKMEDLGRRASKQTSGDNTNSSSFTDSITSFFRPAAEKLEALDANNKAKREAAREEHVRQVTTYVDGDSATPAAKPEANSGSSYFGLFSSGNNDEPEASPEAKPEEASNPEDSFFGWFWSGEDSAKKDADTAENNNTPKP